MSIDHLLNRRMSLHRRVSTDSGSGGLIDTWVNQGTVACRVSQPSATERMLAHQSGAVHTHAVYLAASADVRRGDRLRDAATGETWRVMATVYPSVAGTYLRADAELIQTDGST